MDALSNLTNLRADTVELWDNNAGSYIGIQELVLGIPPASMNTLELVAAALGNDAGYFETVAAGLDSKADLSFTTSELEGKASVLDVDILGDEIDRLDTELAGKANTVDLDIQSDLRDIEIALVNTAVATKANTADIDIQSGLRDAEIAELNTGLAARATIVDIDM